MLKIIITSFLITITIASQAQPALTEGAALLFKNTKSNSTVAEKNKLFIDLNFRISKDRKQFVADGDDSKEFPFDVFVMPTDVNKDGQEEIFITFGNSYTSGSTGSSVLVFIKNAAGKYIPHLGFPGTTPEALAVSNKGYPDLLIGGPGFEFPIWKWNGTGYVFSRKIKDSDYPALKKTSVEEISKTYTAALK
ncbi:MAG: hypothetical protein ACKVOW_21290 [Chitinophagaceae bacterium]